MLFPKWALLFAALVIAVFTACTQTTQPSPTASPEETPTPTESSTATAAPDLSPTTPAINGASSPTPASAQAELPQVERINEVVARFGYALVPAYIPEGFDVSTAQMGATRTQLVFDNSEQRLIIVYPIEFDPEGGEILTPPDDVLVEVDVLGEPSHLMIGGWSDATIQQGPGIDPSLAEWDYEKSLTLFYDYQTEVDGEVGVAVQALFNPSEWITDSELVRIAESLTVVE